MLELGDSRRLRICHFIIIILILIIVLALIFSSIRIVLLVSRSNHLLNLCLVVIKQTNWLTRLLLFDP